MNKAVKKVLAYLVSILLVIGLIAAAPISRTIYYFYDNNRTQEVLKQLEAAAEAAASAAAEEAAPVSSFLKQAYVMQSKEESLRTFDILTLTSETAYELTHYEQTLTESGSFTSEYFHMMGDYTRDGNVITVQPGIGVLSQSADGSSFTHHNAQFLTAEEAAGELTRDEVFAAKYSSNQFALMRDGSFVAGGTSDASDVLGAPDGRHVYTDAVLQGRVTFKTLITFDDGQYILYSESTNSSNAEQTTGAFFGFGSYTITAQGVAPDESAPEQTYDVVSGEVGRGFMYANNNGSHMQFDLQKDGSFSQWLATSFNAVSPTFYASESGCTIKIGALKTVVAPWGMYIPAGDSKEAAPAETQPETTAPAEEPQGLRLEVESSAEGKPFILELNADGTLTTGWTNYEQTLKAGKWAVADGTLNLDLEGTDYTAAVTVNADGTASITVNYGQMGEKVYTMSAEIVSAIGLKAAAPADALTMEVASSVEDKPFVLTLNGDGTAVTGWTNYEQTMKEGTWAVADGALTFDLGDYTAETVMNEDGTASITVNYGQMGEKVYTMPADIVQVLMGTPAAAPAPQALTMKVDSSVEDKPFVLTLNGDGTVLTGWTNYEQTMKEGTWAVNDGALTFDLGDYTAETVVNEDGTASITVNYGQMGEKVYTMPAPAVQIIIGAPAAAKEETPAPQALTMKVDSSVEDKPFVLTLNGDGTVLTGWTNYEQTMKEGTWAVNDGALTFDLGDYTAETVMNEDGTASITVNYGQMGEKVYTMPAQAVQIIIGAPAAEAPAEAAPAPQALTMEVETSVEDKPFVLTLNGDGTVLTGWTNYEQTMKEGKWAVTDGVLTFDLEEAGYSVAVIAGRDGTAVITVDYGQMGSKVYTMPAPAVTVLGFVPEAEALTLELETSVEGKPFVLTLNSDGTVLTGWTNYEQTIKEGTWAVIDETLTLDLGDYTAAVTADEKGDLTIAVNYGQMGDKEYTLTAEEIPGWII